MLCSFIPKTSVEHALPRPVLGMHEQDGGWPPCSRGGRGRGRMSAKLIIWGPGSPMQQLWLLTPEAQQPKELLGSFHVTRVQTTVNIYRIWLRDYPNVCLKSIDIYTQRQILLVQEQPCAHKVFDSTLPCGSWGVCCPFRFIQIRRYFGILTQAQCTLTNDNQFQ